MSVAISTPVPIPNPFSPEALAAKALEKLGADVPTADTILRLAAHLAELVNKAPGLHGPEKAALVQRVLRDVLAMPAVRAGLSDDAASALNIVIETVVPTALTLIISAGRGEFDLSSPQKAAASVWSWCCTHGVAVAAAVAAPKKADTATVATVPAAASEEVRPEVPVAAPAASIAPTESSAPAPAVPV